MNYTQHALDRLQERGITQANCTWCVAGGNYQMRDGGRRYRRRVGQDVVMFVITTADGGTVISAWIRYY